METFESDISPHPVESSKENHVPSISMDDDAWMAARQVPVFNDALGINSGTTSSWPERNDQDLGSGNEFLDDGLKLIDGWMAERPVRAFNDALGINSGTTTSPWPERNHQDLAPEHGPLADWQGQTSLATGVWSNGAFNITPDHEMVPGWTTSQERRAIVAEPGSQAPGVTVNGVALRLPLIKLPWYNQNAMASGRYAQEVLTKVSAGTNLMAERKAACMLRKVYADSKIPNRRHPRRQPKPGESDAIAARLEELRSHRQSSGVLSARSQRASPSLLKVKGAFKDI
jgi:hypothetical protein